MKNGFSIIQLAIVLVISGLLAGGILMGKELILAAKLDRFVRDLATYETATKQFKTKYNFYPGDAPMLIPAGDANNILGSGLNGNSACGRQPYSNLSNEEYFQVFAHLSQSSFIQKYYASFSPAQDGKGNGCIGGIHATDYYLDPKNSGVVAPYTQLDSAAAAAIYANRNVLTDKLNIYAGLNQKPDSTNFYYSFVVTNEFALGLTSKLGEINYPNKDNLRGLANLNGRDKCYFDSFSNIGNCSDSAATMAQMYFYLAP